MKVMMNAIDCPSLQERVKKMGQTGAEWLLEQGKKRDELRVTREVLLDLMATKFGSFPLAMTYKIKAIRNPRRLDALLEKGFTAGYHRGDQN